MIPVRLRGAALFLFLVVLHLLVLYALWRRSEGVAPGVMAISLIPLVLGGTYLLRHLAREVSWLDLWVLLYALWSITSGALYLQEGNPSQVGAFAYGLYNLVLPMACYFATKAVPAEQHPELVSRVVLLNAFAVGFGLYMHLARPDYYRDFLTRALTSQGATQEWQYFARLQSYLGSTSVGYLGAISLVLVTLASPRIRRMMPLLVILFVVGSALALQRAGLIGVAIALLYLIFLYRQQTAGRVMTVLMMVGALSYGVARWQTGTDAVTQRVLDRVTTDMVEGVSAFREVRGYGPGLAYLREFPLGVGLGGTSSAADNAGLVSKGEVADANFMRITADLGGLGLLLFSLCLLQSAWSAWRGRHRIAWLTFLCIHGGIMLSTNILDSYYLSNIFWLLIATIDCDRAPALAAAPQRIRFTDRVDAGTLVVSPPRRIS